MIVCRQLNCSQILVLPVLYRMYSVPVCFRLGRFFCCSTVAQGLASQMAPPGWVAYLRWSNHSIGFSPLFFVKAQAGCILWPEQNDLTISNRLDFNKVYCNSAGSNALLSAS